MNPRPKPTDKNILTTAMRILFDKTIKSNIDVESCGGEDECIGALVRCCDNDGYRFAKNLEDNEGWEVDAVLVDLLNGAYFIVNKQVEIKTEQWVIDNFKDITLFKVGDPVKLLSNRFPSCMRDRACTVTSVKGSIGKYVIIPSESYKEGKSDGYIVNHEDLVYNG